MYRGTDPKWLQKMARQFRWLAVPNIAVIFITLQILGYFSVVSDPIWFNRLALFPDAVLEGQVWRLITFLSVPLSNSLLYMVLALWFAYFTINLIESEWGDFKTTLYFLVSILVTIVFSLATGYPITSVQDFSASLFLAAAALFPDLEIMIYFVVPAKLKWLGWLTMAFVGWRFLTTDWLGRLYLVAIFSNYLLFFGPATLERFKQWKRRQAYRRNLR